MEPEVLRILEEGDLYCVCEKCNPKINCASYDKETYKVRNQSALTTMEVVDWVGLDGIGIG